jgi:hypothetical protein
MITIEPNIHRAGCSVCGSADDVQCVKFTPDATRNGGVLVQLCGGCRTELAMQLGVRCRCGFTHPVVADHLCPKGKRATEAATLRADAERWRAARDLLSRIAEKHARFEARGMRYEATPGVAAFIAEEHALVAELLKLLEVARG